MDFKEINSNLYQNYVGKSIEHELIEEIIEKIKKIKNKDIFTKRQILGLMFYKKKILK